MSNITIGRYAPDEAKNLKTGHGFSAWIEGVDDAGEGWILWLDETGRPCTYYDRRSPSGACDGEPLHLLPYPLDELAAA